MSDQWRDSDELAEELFDWMQDLFKKDNSCFASTKGSDETRACSRCGVMAENCTVGGVMATDDKVYEDISLCIECRRVQYEDVRKFFDEGWERLKGK